jgi:uncharacterized protein (DUF2147 family)
MGREYCRVVLSGRVRRGFLASWLLAAFALVLLAFPTLASAASGRFDRTWGQDVDGANPGTGFEICTIAANCKFGTQSGLGGSMQNPVGVAVDGAGNVYVLESNDERIQKFDSQGNWERAWGKDVVNGGGTGFEICTVAADCKAGTAGTLGGEMFLPEGIAADSAGNVYIADTQSHRIEKFDSQGNFLRAWGVDVVNGGGTGFEICTVAASCKGGTSSGQSGGMSSPLNVGVDAAGTVFVADFGNERIDEFDSQGDFLRAWGKNVDSSNPGTGLEVCLAGSCQAGSTGSLGGEMNLPLAVTGGQAGNVFVNDANNNRVQEFDSQGNWERAWGKDVVSGGGTGFEICTVAANCKAGTTGSLGGELNGLEGLAVDSAGKVYVADEGNQRIDRFDSLGDWERAWGKDVVSGGGTGFELCIVAASCKTGTFGALGGEMSNPSAVAVDPAGNLYVADTNNNRIQKFVDPVLTVQKAGTGSGGVTSSPAGIDCGLLCSLSAEVGTQVTLSASPASGSSFAGWAGGGCSGTSPCTVTMSDDQTVTATFTQVTAPPKPPNTVKLKAKINQKRRTARFTFKGTGKVTGFQCKLTRQSKKLGRWRRCKSPATYRHLKRGRHVFYVRAVGPGGPDHTPARKAFRIR